jgi:hypothetical protein
MAHFSRAKTPLGLQPRLSRFAPWESGKIIFFLPWKKGLTGNGYRSIYVLTLPHLGVLVMTVNLGEVAGRPAVGDIVSPEPGSGGEALRVE